MEYMTESRINAIENGRSLITREEWDRGWRCCCEFDGMVLNCLDPDDPQASICTCQNVPYPGA